MDLMNFKDKEIFTVYSSSIVTMDKQLQNLMDVQNDVIFIWDEEKGCLITQGTRSVCKTHQELRPTERPEFQVQNVSVNESGTRAVLWSPEGAVVLDLPWRCGPKLEFQDGKPEIVVRCRKIDALDLALDAVIAQVRWNPYSTYDSSLVLLTSNNGLFYFDAMPNEIVNVDTLRIGRQPFSRQKTLAALGETAVDFCFAPIFADISSRVPNCGILVVRGNGDVILVFGGSEDWQVLPIYPLPEENYLTDACAILSMPGKPASVILATTRGVIYHTLLVPLDIDQVDVPTYSRKYRLLVVESVALDSGLLHNSEDINAPLSLLLDPHHARRYLVVQPSSVHSVLLNALIGVDNLVRNASESLPKVPASVVEYLVCSGSTIIGAVAALHYLFTIDTENNVVTVPLRCVDVPVQELFTPPDENDYHQFPISKELRQPFQQKVEQLLEESHVIPRFSFPKEQMSREEQLAVIVRISGLIRNEALPRYRQVKAILDHRIKLITSLRSLLMKELDHLEGDRAAVQVAAEEFAEKVQTVSDALEEHKERVQKLVRQVAEANPSLTDAELRLQDNVSEIEGKLNHYQTSLEKLKKNCAYQELKISQEDEQKEIVLSNKQVTAIHGCLSVIGENISQLVHRVNEINQLLGLDD